MHSSVKLSLSLSFKRFNGASRVISRSVNNMSGFNTSSGFATRLNGFDRPTVWHEFTPLANKHGAINLGW
jgi:hypothetical protein